jgi:hypothetical protein
MERVYKEAVVAEFKVLSRYYLEGSRKATKTLDEDSQSLVLHLNPPSPAYGVLTT